MTQLKARVAVVPEPTGGPLHAHPPQPREVSATRALPFIALASIALVTWGATLSPVAPIGDDEPAFAPVRALARYDAGWYAEIAAHGYWYHPGEQSPVAFWPVYPLLIRGLTFLGVNRWVAGELLSLSCALVAVLLFRRWARHVLPQAAETATWILVVYPFAVYLYGVMYSDATFLLLALATFVCVEEDRPWLAAFFGSLASAARPVAIALVVGLVVRIVERRRREKLPLALVDFAPVLAISGFVAWVTYLQVSFGDWHAFATVQAAPGWEQGPGWHTWLKVPWFQMLFPRVAPLVAVRLVGHALATVTGLALVIPMRKRLGWGYAAYCAVALGIPAVGTKDFQGLGRYLIAGFPVFLVAASYLVARPAWRRAWLVTSAITLGLLAVALGMGGYVA
jgi:hypothetical protein